MTICVVPKDPHITNLVCLIVSWRRPMPKLWRSPAWVLNYKPLLCSNNISHIYLYFVMCRSGSSYIGKCLGQAKLLFFKKHVGGRSFFILCSYWDNNLMSQLNTRACTYFSITQSVIVLSYIYTEQNRQMTVATMGTTDIMDQGEWQLYVQY